MCVLYVTPDACMTHIVWYKGNKLLEKANTSITFWSPNRATYAFCYRYCCAILQHEIFITCQERFFWLFPIIFWSVPHRLASDFLPVQELTSRSGRLFTYFLANMAAPSGGGDTGKWRFHVQMMIFARFSRVVTQMSDRAHRPAL